MTNNFESVHWSYRYTYIYIENPDPVDLYLTRIHLHISLISITRLDPHLDDYKQNKRFSKKIIMF